MVKGAIGSFILAAAVLQPALAAPPRGTLPRIERIDVRLLYETSGAVSASIAAPNRFNAWNTMIGEGDAKEPARDLIVQVHLAVAGDEANVDAPLLVKVTDRKGRTLTTRTFASLFFKQGRAVKAVFVPDAACAGRITVTATIGRETRDSAVTLDCGE